MMLRSVILCLVAMLASVQSLMLQTATVAGNAMTAAGQRGASSCVRTQCVCMACRQNLKKDKRLRNRVNAFRFKKGGNTFRFVRPGAYNPEDQKKAEEDSAFFAQVFTYSAEAANAEAAE